MGPWLDRRAARRWFERAALAPANSDALGLEIGRRMAERLDYVRFEPARALLVGCRGAALAGVRARYPDAEIVVTDAAESALRRAREERPLSARARTLIGASRERFAVADPDALPLRAGSTGLVWSNLALAWSCDVGATLREWHRTLEVGGLLMFTTYGPDTLKELRAAFDDVGPHVHPFADMHDVGDALVSSGFADPVMDTEMLTLTYASFEGLVADLRATGQRNAHQQRRRALTGKDRWRRAADGYAAFAQGGRVPATFEIVYGHAWKAPARIAADGRAIIRIDRGRAGTKGG
jgi:malonyl-CoA O-methyltransferase